jgi:hypothetical protein
MSNKDTKFKKATVKAFKECIDDISNNIVHKDGRRPYDKTVLREADESVQGVIATPVPTGYYSIQQHINSNKGRTINKPRLDEYLTKLKKKGWIQISVDDIYSLQKGNRVAYITVDNKWRSGGFLVEIKDSASKYDAKKDKVIENRKKDAEYKPYILYKAFNGSIFSLQAEDIQQLWTRPKKVKGPKNDRVKFKVPYEESSYAVILEDDDGEDVIVYYARDDYTRKRFMKTKKFERAETYGWVFDDDTQGTPVDKESGIQIQLLDDLENDSSDEEDSDSS